MLCVVEVVVSGGVRVWVAGRCGVLCVRSVLKCWGGEE